MPVTGYDERPDYRVDILARRNQVTARAGDRVLARSVRSLLVDEQDHGLVFYFPPTDVSFDLLEPIDYTTRCPYKGVARHWRLIDGAEPAAWSYPEPYPQVGRLLGHVAFYQDQVSVEIGVADPAVVGYQK
jgi:uncharacterized protein (DUF427 family)